AEIERAAVAARLVLDHHRLPELTLQRLRNQPAHDVGDAAGRERDDELDGARWIALGSAQRCNGGAGECEQQQACGGAAERTPRVGTTTLLGMILAVLRALNSP